MIEEMVNKYSNFDFGKTKVDKIEIMQSILHREGPQYITISNFVF